jgi:hypothetical protein
MVDAVIRAYRGENVDEAAARLREESRDIDDPQYVAMGAAPSMEASLAAGRLEDVIAVADEILSLGHPGADGAIFGYRAALWMGDLPTARRMRDAWSVQQPGRRSSTVRSMLDAGVAQLEGRTDEARRGYAEALAGWRSRGLRFELGLCALDVITCGAMDPDERRRVADEARAIFTELRAAPYLSRLDAATRAGDSAGAATQVAGAAPTEARPAS